jgi:glycosyltransferase involved in cell wall biosynthesis
MRILQIAPLWESVPPPAYGGTEAVVHLLVEELVRQGHDVTLWASGDSRTSARLKSCCPQSLRSAEDIYSKSIYSCQHASLALKDAGDYDIVHNHAGEEVMAISSLLPDVRMLTTMHCVITKDTRRIWDSYRSYFNTISWSQRRLMPEIYGDHFAGVAYNAIDVGSFPFHREKADHLLFLSRMSPEKGPTQAIEVARRTGRRLVMAGKVDPKDREYYKREVAPLIDGDQIVFEGEADAVLKRRLYRDAACVIMPIQWDEPFGLVMPEAMACGTPVIVFNRGAAPEIVQHGETGFVVDTLDEMVDAVSRTHTIDPAFCRLRAQQRFDAPIMARRYIDIYESILERGHRVPAMSSNGAGMAKELSPTRVA